MIREPAASELAALRAIELEAGQLFRTVDMAPVAEYQPMSVQELDRFRRAGRAWVVDVDGAPVGYLVAAEVDGNLHIDQVSVHPAHGRRGLGRRLIEHAASVAVAAGHPALTLTTFLEVPWNGPFYRRCGFAEIPAAEVTPGLRAIRDHEIALGLDRWPRCCMRRPLA